MTSQQDASALGPGAAGQNKKTSILQRRPFPPLGPFLLSLARLVKLEHSIFALPFAYAGAFLAAKGWPGWRAFLLVTVAMVAVRSLAMAANRLIDLKYDRLNPRTQRRELVTGEVSVRAAVVLCVVAALVFGAACVAMNGLVARLAPIAIACAVGYSYAKRFTWLCHWLLGLVLAFAPVGGWLAVTGAFQPAPVVLGLGVLFWVAGFDLLYACQDVEFDRRMELHAFPARFGVATALVVSTFCHVNTALFFLLAAWMVGAGVWHWGVVGLIAIILVAEHKLFRPDDLSRVTLTFFTFNGVIAVVYFVGVLLDLMLHG